MTLALRALPRGRGVAGVPRALLLDALHSRVARFVSHPLFTLPLFLVSLYGVYFTPVFDALMGDPVGHQFMLAHFTVTGLLFFGPILAQDPWPRQVGHAGRMLELLIPMPLHAFFGVFLMMATSLLVDHFAAPTLALGIDPIEDQRLAGGLAWSYGEAPTLLMLMFVMHRWFRDDTARDAADARYADTHGDPELDAYNAYLDTLRQKDT